jgi:hypothetical protein
MRVEVDTAAGAADVVIHGVFHEDAERVRVSVAGDTTRIAGRVTTEETGLRFRPAFPFDPGREYEVSVDGRSGARQFRLPALNVKPSARVTRIYPTSDTLPENQLRLYVEFSMPMSRQGGLPYVKLLDADGNEVKNAFLPLDADFWNRDRTRYTLFLDPGRVKRGILPNEQMGRALTAGRRYSIVVDSTWPDGRGQPLVNSYTKTFRAGPADFEPIRLAGWRVSSPAAATSAPLVIRFPEPLDHGLLGRALGIETDGGAAVDGVVAIEARDHEWRFTPAKPWTAGDYRVIVLDFLEDLAGNRVNRAFEVDLFVKADSVTAPSRFTVPFRVK